ncbi:ABC transporter substrate-binding protein [Brevibacillus massiliensis]|uniref:ABC transporter substrate-binding protein n=1 Tax=Brevibacillus massiliensis TaxID=1118054 RepID=UPI000313A238|nr:ABC transporter substrate-binding protein [Brevibacillus massiliensis]
MRKHKILHALLALFVLVTTACSPAQEAAPQDGSQPGSGSAPSAAAGKQEKLRVAISVSPPSLDLLKTTAVAAVQIGWHIFESLVTLDEQYQVAPLLAETIDVSEDGKKISFTLREGLKFHNGKDVTTDDVIASLNRWKELSNNGKASIEHAVITAKDSRTIEIALDSAGPSSQFVLSSMAFPQQGAAIMPKEVIEAADDTGVKEYIGTGPFKFVEWKQDQYIHLQKYDGYLPVDQPPSGRAGKKQALVNDLYFIPVTDAATRVAGIQSGEYDFTDDIPIDNYDLVKDDPNLEASISKPRRWLGLMFNNKSRLFANKKARQAVNAGLDLDTVMMAATGNPEFYRLDHGLMYPEQVWYVEDGKEQYNQKDTEKAKQLLAEAGYKGEPITILGTRDYEFLYKAAVVVKDQLEKLGATVNLEIYDWPTLIQKRSDDKVWDIYFTYFPIYTNPTQPIFLDSRNQYAGWYNNPRMDQLLDQIRASASFDEQKALFRQVQSLFWDDVPAIKLGDMHGLSAYRKNLKGYHYFYDTSFWNVSLE